MSIRGESEVQKKLAKSSSKQLGKIPFLISTNKDVGFAIGVMAIVSMLFIPLPAFLLDFGLALSLALSVLILMVALWIGTPIEFNSFPTLLLVVTMLRLSLNVSSTRLILSEGHTGPEAAGSIIEGFSRFVVNGDFVIGLVIFSILVVINFVVITKGSTRIAEVAARFSLDAMPGKQMAIDADIGAGLISESEAKVRRVELENESAFFGAMDGASKFVRGDAIAGIIITFINVIGGISIGLLHHNLSFNQAITNYTTLTIGDGLVTQVPALIVSLSAGILVTKSGTKGAANEAVILQLTSFPKALFMAGSLALLVGLLPGFPFVTFAGLSGGLFFLGYLMLSNASKSEENNHAVENSSQDGAREETIPGKMKLDEVRLDLGTSLIPLIASVEASLPAKVQSLRDLFIREYGFVLPKVRIRDSLELAPKFYSISIHGVESSKGEVNPNGMMVITPKGGELDVPGELTREPTFGLPAKWVDSSQANVAEEKGYTVVDPESVITTHLTEVIRENMPDLLTYTATKQLLDGLEENYQKLAADISTGSPVVLLQHVLQALLAERISIRNLPKIVEVVSEAAGTSSNVLNITERVRSKLSSQICQSLSDNEGFVSVIVLAPDWDEELNGAISNASEEKNLIMSPSRIQEFVLSVRNVIESFSASDEWPALLVSPDVRPFVRSMLERVSPMTQVISHSEIHRKATIKTVASVSQG